MPLPDKPYDPPELPEEIDAYPPGLGEVAKQYRETLRPEPRDYVTIYFRARRRHWDLLLWQLLKSKVIKLEEMYSPKYLPYWTVGIRIRLKRSYAMGKLMEIIKSRLGLTSPGVRFCLDGFFGMVNFSDIFGKVVDVCPWMQVSSFSTVDSLKLSSGDSIFVSIASEAQMENVVNHCKRRALEGTTPNPIRISDTLHTKVGFEGKGSITIG